MVRAGAFEFALVEAESKVPFKLGRPTLKQSLVLNTFLSAKKVDKTETDVCLSYSVDGSRINCCLPYGKKTVDREPNYKGFRSCENSVSSHTALEFVKPKFSAGTDTERNLAGMGKVEIFVHEFQYTGRMEQPRKSISNFNAANVNVDAAVTSKKKNLSSAEGTATIPKHHRTAREIKKGRHLNTSKQQFSFSLFVCDCFSLTGTHQNTLVAMLQNPMEIISHPQLLRRPRFDEGWGPSQAGNVGISSYEESSET